MNGNLVLWVNSSYLNFSTSYKLGSYKTGPDTRLPQSRAGGQGPYLGRSSEAKDRKKKTIKFDRWTDGPMDGETVKAGCRV